MGNLASDLLQSSSQISDHVEAGTRSETFDIKIHNTHWLEPGEGVFRSPRCFIELICSDTRLVAGNRLSSRHDDRFVDFGSIAFISNDEPLHCRWQSGAQRTVSCGFDIDKIADRTAVDWTWPQFDWKSALAIRNDFIAAMLRRIANETISPGFAGSVQIENLLLGIAFELRRQFAGERYQAPADNGKLDSRQLRTIHAMAIDLPGGPPSIADLADAVGMGGRQLAMRFRATTGQTLRSFLADSRLERGKTLLCDRRRLIKQVAFDCGFKSSAAFAAAFARKTGQSPQVFRDNHC